MSTEGGTKAVIAALGANMGIAVAKFTAWSMSGSSSMLSEAIHSVADSGNQVLLLIGGKRSQKLASDTHQFGYGRLRYVYAFVVSIVLFSLGGLFSAYEGFHKIRHPEEVRDVKLALIVLGIAIVLESFSFRTAVVEANKSRGAIPMAQYVKRARQPELPVILLEDAGALCGLVIAFVCISLSAITQNAFFDGLGAMLVGVLLIIIAVFLAKEMASLLVGETALPEEVAGIETALADSPIVNQLIHLRTMHLGPDELLVTAKIGVDPHASGIDISAGIDEAEARIREAVPHAKYVFIEPDIHNEQLSGG